MKEIAVLNGELNGIHETLATLKTQLCARSYSEPSHALSPRHHTLAMHASPTENEHAVGRAHLRLCCARRYGRFGNNINLEENPSSA